jgi:MFS family permease
MGAAHPGGTLLKGLRALVYQPGHRLYYGWYIVVACNFVAVMTWGIGIFNQGVFLAFFEREYGWTRAELAVGPTLFHIWAGVIGIAVGRLIDRLGPRPILVCGAVTLGAGTIDIMTSDG